MGLSEILPAKVRQIAYAVFGFVGLGLGAIQVGIQAAPGAVQPTWLTVSLVVLPFLATGFGFTAAANVPQTHPALFVSGQVTEQRLTDQQVAGLAKIVGAEPAELVPDPNRDDADPYL